MEAAVVTQAIRKLWTLMAAISLVLVAYGYASAQDERSSPQAQMSLGDIARAVRAQKQNEPKAARVIDDDNLTRSGSGISVVGSSAVGSSAESRSTGASGGKVILLDFWASWCGPCRQSVPDLKQLQKVFSPDQIELVSINEDRNESAGRSFVAQNDMTWEQQFDSAGETARQYRVNAYPTFILTDESGNVLQRFVGEDPNEPLAARIAPYMKITSKKQL